MRIATWGCGREAGEGVNNNKWTCAVQTHVVQGSALKELSLFCMIFTLLVWVEYTWLYGPGNRSCVALVILLTG